MRNVSVNIFDFSKKLNTKIIIFKFYFIKDFDF